MTATVSTTEGQRHEKGKQASNALYCCIQWCSFVQNKIFASFNKCQIVMLSRLGQIISETAQLEDLLILTSGEYISVVVQTREITNW